jgi:hypothetical protein
MPHLLWENNRSLTNLLADLPFCRISDASCRMRPWGGSFFPKINKSKIAITGSSTGFWAVNLA